MQDGSGLRGKFTQVKTARRRSNSSTRWLSRQLNDPYIQKAKAAGYRSRAAYKLIEIDKKFHIFKKGMNVIDLGAAPGSWCQVVVDKIFDNSDNAENKVIAIDLLDIDPMPGVLFLQSDFTDNKTHQWIKDQLNGGLVDVVLSDMAANTTGHKATDHLRIMNLCEDTYHFAIESLKPGGHFITKIFRGGTEAALLQEIKKHFKKVKHFKPSSSRKESSEFYLVALDRKG